MNEKISLYLKQYQDLYGQQLYIDKSKKRIKKIDILHELISWIMNIELENKTNKNSQNEYFSKIDSCFKYSLDNIPNFIFGMGNLSSKIVFLVESPGKINDLQNLSFIGESGKLLDRILKAINLTRDDVYILNVLKCKKPENMDPSKKEIDLCEQYLKAQLRIVKPKLIIALGRISALTLLKTDSNLSDLRKRVHKYDDIDFFVTYHPSALIKNPNFKKKAWEDFKLIRDKYLA